MIVDSHVHTFPYMGGRSGFPSVDAHLKRMQKSACSSINPPLRKRDNSPVRNRTLWDGMDPSPAGLADVGFRVAKFGRFEWTTDSEQVYLQYFAPSLVDNISTADYTIAEMDYAGVDVAVLQNSPMYGILNDFFADCVQQFPTRYVALAHVNEAKADTDAELSELHRCAETLGHKGLFYEVGGFWENGYQEHMDDVKYEPFWDEVQRLGLVLYYYPKPSSPTADAYADQLRRVCRVLERHPGIPTVLVQAFPIPYLAREGRYQLPEVAFELGKLPDFLMEIAFPISHGHEWEYPYMEAHSLIHQLYDWFGPEKLVWGSDMPNVLRFCTYRQSYQYFRRCTFLPPSDADLLLGGNLARLFGLKAI